jgi:uncharacterized protein YggE
MKSMLKTLGLAIGILVTLILGISLLSQTGRAEPARQADEDGSGRRTVSVTGVGRANARPDQAVLRVGVQTEADSASDALTENNTQMESLLATLEEAGIPEADIQTQSLQLFPRYTQTSAEDVPTLAGYVAINIVEARVAEIDNLGEVLDAAVAAGGNTIDSIRFEFSDPAEVLEQARSAAMQDVQDKAGQLASLAGGELGEVLTISESTRTPPVFFDESQPAADQAIVPIEPGTQSVEVEVQVTWILQ